MDKRTVILVTLIVCLALLAGCTRTARLRPGTQPSDEDRIVQLQTLEGTILQFDKHGGHLSPTESAVIGLARVVPFDFSDPWDERERPDMSDVAFTPRSVPADSVTQFWVRKTDVPATLVLVLLVTAGAVGITAAVIAAAKDSCPFVYSYDGERYVFDAEPLGGAICRGLRRTECSRLEHLREVAGEYRLLLRNEVNETQYLDAMRLRAVDHAPDQEIVPDIAGNLHVVSQAEPPRAAHDETGRDIARPLRTRGGAAWLTHTPALTAAESDLRHHLTVEFPKPPDARRARLVVNAGTALWGSNMIREMLQLRGDAVDAWYDEIGRGGERLAELAVFNMREELYVLRVRAEQGSELVERALISGSGPFMPEDRVITFDVSDLPGETLTLHLDPPKGFWTLDYMAVEYDPDRIATSQTLILERGRDQDGRDIAGSLREPDGDSYVMPRNGDWAELTFAAPAPVAEGQVRSIFLETSGYYEIQIDKRRPEATAQVQRLLNEPGAIVRYSIERYLEWRQQHASLQR